MCLIYESSFHTKRLFFIYSLRNVHFFFYHSLICSFIHPSIHPSILPSIHPSIHPFICSFVNLFVHSIVCLFLSFIHSFFLPSLPSSICSSICPTFLPSFQYDKIEKKIMNVLASALDLENLTALFIYAAERRPDF